MATFGSIGCVTGMDGGGGSKTATVAPGLSASHGQAQDLADGLDDRQAVSEMGSYRILDLPGVGGFYLPASLLSNLRRDRVAARIKLRSAPHDILSLQSLAVYELALGNPAGARSYMNIARSGGAGENSISGVIEGIIQYGLGQPIQARKEFAAAERFREGFILAHLNQGLYALGAGSASQAALHFQQVVNVDKRNALARLHLGQALYVQRNFKQALAQFDEALMNAPENALIQFNRAVVLHRGMRQFTEARVAFRKVISSDKAGMRLKIRASGALQNLDRDEHGAENLATIGAY